MGLRVTLPQQCLLYLLDRADIREDDRGAQEMTQDRIAQAVNARRSHVSRAMGRLQTRELVETAKVHVAGESRRRLAYFLTEDGLRRAQTLRKNIEDERLPIVDLQGNEAQRRLYEVPLLLPRRPKLSDLVSNIRGGRLDLRQFLDRQARLKGGKVYDAQDVAAPAHFRGRIDELDRLQTFLVDPKARGLVLLGLPGIGKTALASKWVASLKGRLHVFWRRLNPDTTQVELLRDVAGLLAAAGRPALYDYLQRPPEGGESIALSLLRDDLALAAPLLVLDDAHRAGPGISSLFSELLRPDLLLGATKILFLSRERVGFVRSEDLARSRVWELELDDLARADALAVLQALGTPTPRCDQILDTCGGHPLSLELAGAGRLPLVGVRRTSAAWFAEEGLARLDARGRRALSFAAVFEGAIPLAALGSETHELLRRCLLREVEGGKAVVHDLIRESVLQSLPSHRLSALHLQAGNLLASRGNPGDTVAAIRHFLRGGAFSRASTLALERGKEVVEAGLAGAFLPLLRNEAWVAARRSPPARLGLLRGQALLALGRPREASREFEGCRRTRDPTTAAEASLGQGKAELLRGSQLALPLLDDAAGRLERLGALRLLAEAMYWIGGVHEDAGRYEKGQEAFERGRAIALDLGDRRWEGLCTYGLGRLLSLQDDYLGAVQREREALSLLERDGYRLDVAKVCAGLGGNLYELKRFDEAEPYLHRATAEARSTGATSILASSLYNLAVILQEKGDVDGMIPMLEESLTAYEMTEEYVGAVGSAAWLAFGSWNRGREETAERYLQRAEDLLARTREPMLRVRALRRLGRACREAERRDQARGYLQRAAVQAREAKLAEVAREITEDLQKLA